MQSSTTIRSNTLKPYLSPSHLALRPCPAPPPRCGFSPPPCAPPDAAPRRRRGPPLCPPPPLSRGRRIVPPQPIPCITPPRLQPAGAPPPLPRPPAAPPPLPRAACPQRCRRRRCRPPVSEKMIEKNVKVQHFQNIVQHFQCIDPTFFNCRFNIFELLVQHFFL